MIEATLDLAATALKVFFYKIQQRLKCRLRLRIFLVALVFFALPIAPVFAQWTPVQIPVRLKIQNPIVFYQGNASADQAELEAGSVIEINVSASSARALGKKARVSSAQLLKYLKGNGAVQVNVVSIAPGSGTPAGTKFGRVGMATLRTMVRHGDFSITQTLGANDPSSGTSTAAPQPYQSAPSTGTENQAPAPPSPSARLEAEASCQHCKTVPNLGGEEARGQVQAAAKTVAQTDSSGSYDGFTAAEIESFRRNITPASLAQYAQSAKVQNLFRAIHNTDLSLHHGRQNLNVLPNYHCYHYFKQDACRAGFVDCGSLAGKYASQAPAEMQATHRYINLLDHHIFPDGRFDYLKDPSVLADGGRQRGFMGVTFVSASHYAGRPREGDIQTLTPYGYESVWVNPKGAMVNQTDGYKYYISGAMIDPSVLTGMADS